MHPYTVAIFVATIAFALGVVKIWRDWKTVESRLGDEFLRLLELYRGRFGSTETGSSFLERVGPVSRDRQPLDSDVVLSNAAATGIWSGVLGASGSTSIIAGLVTAAAGFVADAVAKARADRGKTADQISEEVRIAEFLRDYAGKKKETEETIGWISVIYVAFVVIYLIWKIY